MKKSIVKLLLIEIILFVSIVIFNLFNIYSGIMKIILWGVMALCSYLFLGFPRDKNYYKSYVIRIVIISFFATLIIIYGIGMFTGFAKNVFDLSLVGILKNTIPIILVIVSMEIIRYIYCKYVFRNKIPIIILTIMYIILDITMEMNHYNMYDFEDVFRFVCAVVCPAIASELLCTFLTGRVSLVPSLIYKLVMNLYTYILPFIPSLGEYIYCVINVMLPFIIYINVNKLLKYNDKKDYDIKKNMAYVFCIPLIIFLLIIVVLISGIFDYKMIAIGSDSMNPVYEKGDAVIYKKISDVNDIKKGDILVFDAGDKVVTHRVVDITKYKNMTRFITKGDNNDSEDNYITTKDNVLGIVKYYVKYIGRPTIWLYENKEKG